MLFNRAPKLTYANVTATLALFLTFGGVSYAAVELPRDSVGTPQLRDGAVDSAKIKDGALQYEDFGFGQIPAGLKGPQGDRGVRGTRGARGAKGDRGAPGAAGATGAPGAPGAAGAAGATSVLARTSGEVDLGLQYGVAHTAVAQCAAGERAVGGGFTASQNPSNVRIISNAPTAADGAIPTDWEVEAELETNLATGQYAFVKATVVCAKP